MKRTCKRAFLLILSFCMIVPLCSVSLPSASAAPVTNGDGSYSLDLSDYANQWAYNTSGETDYWYVDVVYCANPTVVNGAAIQTLRIYAPAPYMADNRAGNVALANGTVTSTSGVTYSAATAPIIYRNSSGGYSASSINAVTENNILDYIKQGYVVVSIQTRGSATKDAAGNYIGQFPAIIVDLKAGIRYLKANADIVPGNPERIVSAGHSSGGGVSAMLGASGNASVFDSYLAGIGAADTSDDIFITMGSAPMTNLSTADASYEWYQYGATEYFLFNAMNTYSYTDAAGANTPFSSTGNTWYFELGGNTLGGTHEDELSEVLKDMYVEYIQGLGFDLRDGGHSGAYWDDFVQLHTDGLNDYISRMTDEEAEAYVKGLANWSEWISWDDSTKTATITNFTGMLENYVPRKNMVGALDTYNYLSNENAAFVNDDGTRKHFSSIVRDALGYLVSSYGGSGWEGEALAGTAYKQYSAQKTQGGTVIASDTWTDEHRTMTQQGSLDYLNELYNAYDNDVTEESAYLLDVMSPTSYILGEGGFDDADISPYWRLRFGGTDGGVSIAEAWFMANALEEYHPEVDVHIGVAWTMGHQFAEPYMEEFYSYIDDIMVAAIEVPTYPVSPTAYYTVSFSTNGGGPIASQSVASGGKVTEPTAPVREGYTFAGWFTDAALTSAYDFNLTVTSAITLYAKWTVAAGTSNPFVDVKQTDWFYDAVMYVYENGIMNGIGDQLFNPNANLTRGMMAQILYNLEDQPAAGSADFSDVHSGAWYAKAVAWAAENEIVLGVGENKFEPESGITREQMAVMLYCYCQFKEITLPATRTGFFTDAASINSWADTAVNAMYQAKILNGMTDGSFNPQGTATRAEVAQMLMNFIEVIG